jgi:hypothetical protein
MITTKVGNRTLDDIKTECAQLDELGIYYDSNLMTVTSKPPVSFDVILRVQDKPRQEPYSPEAPLVFPVTTTFEYHNKDNTTTTLSYRELSSKLFADLISNPRYSYKFKLTQSSTSATASHYYGGSYYSSYKSDAEEFARSCIHKVADYAILNCATNAQAKVNVVVALQSSISEVLKLDYGSDSIASVNTVGDNQYEVQFNEKTFEAKGKSILKEVKDSIYYWMERRVLICAIEYLTGKVFPVSVTKTQVKNYLSSLPDNFIGLYDLDRIKKLENLVRNHENKRNIKSLITGFINNNIPAKSLMKRWKDELV